MKITNKEKEAIRFCLFQKMCLLEDQINNFTEIGGQWNFKQRLKLWEKMKDTHNILVKFGGEYWHSFTKEQVKEFYNAR
tara:strand:- start:288 stop:524 length:237 start_codon:yes stop_codon:yes gene_type:complete